VTVPLTAGVTVAVKVTELPTLDGLGVDVSAVEVPIRFTTWDTVLEVLDP
jgi:hypothetical protein